MFRLLFISLFLLNSQSLFAANETEIKVRFVHYDREFDNQENDRLQNGFGVIVRHEQSFLDNKLRIGGAGYLAERIQAQGRQREDVFAFDDNEVTGFNQLGESYISISPYKNLEIKYGRDQHQSLFFKSKSRALPSTFQGLSVNWAYKNTQIYAHRFDKWSRRANDEFESFATNTSELGSISNITILGLNYKGLSSFFGEYKVNSEYLESSNYLRKWGLVTQTEKNLTDSLKLNLTAAAFTSRDAGELFIDGSNSALDSSGDTSNDRLQHRGFGFYFTIGLSNKYHSLAISRSEFNEPWLEDNFDGDHGTSPFPTRTYGPELSNANETVWLVDYGYKWSNGILNGLKTNLSYAKGTGAQNSVSAELGRGKESWFETDISYKHPRLKQLKFRLRFRDYTSRVSGEIEGIASNRDEVRFTVDYSHTF